MKRQRVRRNSNVYVEYSDMLDNDIPLEAKKQETIGKWVEAQVQQGDTLQAIALRFNCTIAELKRINKIDKDNEIYARSVIRVPMTPHSVLLETLPKVHTSGSNSPKNIGNTSKTADALTNKTDLNEKLIVAAVSNASFSNEKSINEIILETSIKSNYYTDNDPLEGSSNSTHHHKKIRTSEKEPLLLSGELDDSVPQPRPIRIRRNINDDFSCSGSDFDMSWICLFVFILALCFAIPLIYIVWLQKHHHHDMHGMETHNNNISLLSNIKLSKLNTTLKPL